GEPGDRGPGGPGRDHGAPRLPSRPRLRAARGKARRLRRRDPSHQGRRGSGGGLMAHAAPPPLKLLAQDEDDLAVISAAMQDAVAKVGDIVFEPKGRRLTIAFNRYSWEAGGGARVRSGLQLGGVLKVETRKVRRDAPDSVIEILAMTFEPGAPPGGTV